MDILFQILAAFSFLSILSVGKIYLNKEENLGKSVAFFPLVGIFIGTLSGLFFLLNNIGVSHTIIVAASLTTPLFLTGGLHFDGLLDTFDGIYGKRDKETILAIMRDSSNGAMGILSAVLVYSLKFAFLFSLNAKHLLPVMITACTLSRFTMTLCCCFIPYARDNGKGKIFSIYAGYRQSIIAAFITFIPLGLICGLKTLLVALITLLLTAIFIYHIYKKINGITGDTLGATNEIAELLTIIVFYFFTLI